MLPRRPPVLLLLPPLNTHTRTHRQGCARSVRDSVKKQQEKSAGHKELQRSWGKVKFFFSSANYSSIRTANSPSKRKKKKNIKGDNHFQKKQTLYNTVAPKHLRSGRLKQREPSKQVNRQDTVFTISCSLSAEEFDLFSPVYPAVSQTQCGVSQLQRPIGDRFGGKRSNIHS